MYNYIAQQEARFQRDMSTYSKRIAEASKRDSSAMKGIAILTMVFLPSTFVAVRTEFVFFFFSHRNS